LKTHANYTKQSRETSFQEVLQELQGRAPKGPFEFTNDLKLSDVRILDTDPPVLQRFKRAIKRDGKFGAAGPVYIRNFGFHQALRHAYEGGKRLIDGGAP
jgi:hypothetical protein